MQRSRRRAALVVSRRAVRRPADVERWAPRAQPLTSEASRASGLVSFAPTSCDCNWLLAAIAMRNDMHCAHAQPSASDWRALLGAAVLAAGAARGCGARRAAARAGPPSRPAKWRRTGQPHGPGRQGGRRRREVELARPEGSGRKVCWGRKVEADTESHRE